MKRLAGLFAVMGLGAFAFSLFLFPTAPSMAAAHLVPAPKVDEAREPGLRTAVLAGGCFWGMEGVFEHVAGVKSVVSGYAGPSAAGANYWAVSTQRAPHAEAVRITYDPARVTYGQLLRIYFSVAHDPTQVNRQGPDVGRSYRSAIFPRNADQRRIAGAYLAQLRAQRATPRPIATRLESGRFFPAEAEHQDFMRRNPNHGYVVTHDRPKLAALRANFPSFWRR